MPGPLSPAPAGEGRPEGLPLGSPQRGSRFGKAKRWEALSQPGAFHKASGEASRVPHRSEAIRAWGGLEGLLLVFGKPVANI